MATKKRETPVAGEKRKEASVPELIFATPASGNFLANLDQGQRKKVIEAAERIRVPKGDLLFSQGGKHRGVILILSGVVRVYYVSPDGREFTLAFWQQSDLAGTPDLFGDARDAVYRWSGVAVADTEALIFRPGRLRELVKTIPILAIEIIEALETKIRLTSNLLQMMGTMRVNKRLILCLKSLAEAYGVQTEEGIVLQLPFTHESISTMVGATRQWTTLELNRMQRKGILKLSRNSLTILKPKLLDVTSL